MLRGIVISVLILWSCAVASGQDRPEFDLRQKIPSERHSATGIDRLTDSQIRALSAEVFSLMEQEYRRGQADLQREKANGVAVIAPSVATAEVARDVLRRMNWIEVKPRRTKVVLVVIKSGLFIPLQMSYNSFGELRKDAERQINTAGLSFHIYLYLMDDNLRVMQDQHVTEDASEPVRGRRAGDVDTSEEPPLVPPAEMTERPLS